MAVSNRPGAEPKNKHGGWDPMPELTITSPNVHSRVDSNTFTIGQPYARVDLNPMPESTLSPSQGLRIWPRYTLSFLFAPASQPLWQWGR
jgi:hypothetical protein